MGAGRNARVPLVFHPGMPTSIRRSILLLAPALTLSILVGACGSQGNGTSGAADPALLALSAALESGSAASGTLLCRPADLQVTACNGLAAGAACAIPGPLGLPVPGTCRTTLDGSAVACAPNPPAPPVEVVAACAGKAAGVACEVLEPFGIVRDGVCMTARDGSTLVCGRVHTPPPVAVDACTGKAAGDACTVVASGGLPAISGVCSLGPASTGPLACAPRQDLIPNGEAACAGLPAGAACTLGQGHATVGGSCVVPAAGGAPVCLVDCAALRGRFECRGPGGH